MSSKRNTVRKILDEKEGLSKAMKFCTYQERCIQDVIKALHRWNVQTKHFDSIIDQLVEDDFLNEKRFCKSYVLGKFNSRKWGRRKIHYELRSKGLSDENINSAIEYINEDEYIRIASKLIENKLKTYENESAFVIRRKLLWYLVGKGYEKEVIVNLFNKFETLKIE